MNIEFKNSALGTSVSISDDSSEQEVMLETTYDNSEAWHSFRTIKDLDEFLNSMVFMRNRFAKVIGLNEELTIKFK